MDFPCRMTAKEAQDRKAERIEDVKKRITEFDEWSKYHRHRVLKHLEDVPERYKYNYIKAMDPDTRSMGNAVKAKCLDCVGFEAVAEEIGGCLSVICPLWPYRPYRSTVQGAGLTRPEK